jgi:hypothetical protein
MGSSLLDNMGRQHIVTGVVAANGESMTCNDGSASIATDGTGQYTVTFGDVFLSAPVVTVSVVDTTLSTTAAQGAVVNAVTTATMQLQSWQCYVDGGTATDIINASTDLITQFIAVGLRDN